MLNLVTAVDEREALSLIDDARNSHIGLVMYLSKDLFTRWFELDTHFLGINFWAMKSNGDGKFTHIKLDHMHRAGCRYKSLTQRDFYPCTLTA